jgi:hypothetical protein
VTVRLLDRLFVVVFARYRRKDSNLESAWLRAANRVSGYLVLPVAAATLVLIAIVYSFMQTGTPIEHKRTGQIFTGVAGVLIFYMLNRRFRQYLSVPPALPSLETRTDTQLVFWFRLISVGIFILACLTGFLFHRAGYLQGF